MQAKFHVMIILFSTFSLNLKMVNKKEKNYKNLNIKRTKKMF